MFGVLGPGGSTTRRQGDTFRHAALAPGGPVQVALRYSGGDVLAEAWGPGAAGQLEALPRMLGLAGDSGPFEPPPGIVRQLARRNRGLRLGSTGRVYEAIAPTILGQRVTSGEAKSGYARLVRAYGETAPGPDGLRLPPSPDVLGGLGYEEFHRHGIERSRAMNLREVARRANRLEEITGMGREAAYRRLTAVRGVGPWTAGHVMAIAWGDNDAVPVGDFHLPNTIAWALAGEPRGDDARMLELLEPYRPHRRRVVLLLKQAGAAAPKYGAKTPIHDIRPH